MNYKNFFSTIFTYTPKKEYNFDLLEKNTSLKNEKKIDNLKDNVINTKNIFPSIKVNLEYIKSKYNFLINSDVVIREFILNARGKQYFAFLIYVDGLIDTQILNRFVLEPLMTRSQNTLYDGNQTRIISEAISNNITVRKVKKFNLSEYILNSLMPQNTVKKVKTFEDIFNSINSGDCALFIDTLDVSFDIDVKGFKQRNINKPENEIVIKGAHEAFVENIRTNTSLIRRSVHNENLIIEDISIGEITKTTCALCYMENIANSDLVAEIKYRLNNIQVDSLLSSGELEQLLVDKNLLALPEVISTERPDKATSYLLDGRIVVFVNGSPYALILPAILTDFLTSPDDKNMKNLFTNFIKAIRILACFITLLLPGIYVAISSYHTEVIPTDLLYSIISSRQNVPFPIIFEILVLEISFELIREAGIRVPSPIGPTIRNCWCISSRSSCCISWCCKSYFNNYSCYYRYIIICYS